VEGDCALALSTINAAPIARKKTIAVALNFIFPLIILGEKKIALTLWLNRRTLTACRDAASRLSRKVPPHPRRWRDLSRNKAGEANNGLRGTQHPNWGEVISPAGRPCRADT
jgi:hypothetical protein